MRIFHRICKSLYRAGYSVDIAVNMRGDEKAFAGINAHSLGQWAPGARGDSLSVRMARCKRAFQLAVARQADINAFYSLEYVPWAVAMKRKIKRPVIFDCMEDFEAYALQKAGIPGPLRRPLAWAIGATLRWSSRHIDAMVVSDAATGKRFERSAQRVLVVHNFPELALFPSPSIAAEPPTFDLTYHGSLPRYHLETCLAADDALAARGKKVRWRFIGRMLCKEWFTAEIAKRGALERFALVDLVPHDQIAQEVRKAKIGIIPLPDLPKFHSNIPQKLFEFMALGMPVVMSDLAPSRPFMGDGKAGFMVNPSDPGAYAEAILRLLQSPGLCQEMGAEGRRRVEQQYNWERESQKLLTLYQELLHHGS